MRGFAGGFLSFTGMVYVMLMTNLLLAATCLPVWVLALLVDLRYSWLWVAATSILLGPALAGAFTVFRNYSVDGSVAAARGFFSGWWGQARRVLPVTLGCQVFLFVLGVDFYALSLWGYAALALPVTIVLVALVLVTAMPAWVGLLGQPGSALGQPGSALGQPGSVRGQPGSALGQPGSVRGQPLTRRAIVKASVYYAVRKPGWSLASLAVLGLVGSVIWVSPAIGLGLLLAPGLYVVWGNSRRVMADLLPASEQVVDEEGETSTLFRRGQVRQ